MRVAVLVSGSGTNLEAMFRARVPVHLVVADRPCPALQMATNHRVAAELVDRAAWGGFGPGFQRVAYTEAVTEVLSSSRTDLAALAGFGTVLAAPIHDAFPGRVLNTHPSLLPSFPGWRAVEDALAAKVTETGCTVHVATLDLDAGPILAQEVVPVLPDDTVETLHERIKHVEHRLYPATIHRVIAELEAGRTAEALALTQADTA